MNLTKTIAHPLAALALVVAVLPVAGCGPTVFQGNSGLKIVGDLPPLPPPKIKPPPKPQRVQLTANKIVINEKVQFDYDKATIKEVSHSLLDEVTKVIQDNPQLKKIRIEGHASREQKSVAADNYNKRLSDQRAKAVMQYLVSKGVDKNRLEAVGYGVEKPIASNDTDEGREKNRRVEFNIIEQVPKGAAGAATKPAAATTPAAPKTATTPKPEEKK